MLKEFVLFATVSTFWAAMKAKFASAYIKFGSIGSFAERDYCRAKMKRIINCTINESDIFSEYILALFFDSISHTASQQHSISNVNSFMSHEVAA